MYAQRVCDVVRDGYYEQRPIMLALGLPDVRSPKIMPRLVTVDDVAPKLNLLGSLGNFTKQASYQ